MNQEAQIDRIAFGRDIRVHLREIQADLFEHLPALCMDLRNIGRDVRGIRVHLNPDTELQDHVKYHDVSNAPHEGCQFCDQHWAHPWDERFKRPEYYELVEKNRIEKAQAEHYVRGERDAGNPDVTV